jgi:hypothetical protein
VALIERVEAFCIAQRVKRQESGVEWDHEFEVQAELLLNLAESLAKGAGLAQAAVSREFRLLMAEMTKEDTDGDDEFGGFLAGLDKPASGFGVTGVSPLGHS